METTALLIPIEGVLVRDPVTGAPLQAAGELKPLIGKEGRYWRRRIKDGTVIVNPTVKSKRGR